MNVRRDSSAFAIISSFDNSDSFRRTGVSLPTALVATDERVCGADFCDWGRDTIRPSCVFLCVVKRVCRLFRSAVNIMFSGQPVARKSIIKDTSVNETRYFSEIYDGRFG